jgi:hypothetical protein
VQWLPLDAINPLPGLLAGILIFILSLLSVGYIRRRWYEVTLVAHGVWPVIVAFSCLHTWGSKGSSLPILLPGVVLLGLDFLLMALDLFLRPITVLDAGVISDRPDDPLWHRTAFLVCEKRGRWAWIDAFWPFLYVPGNYVNIIIRSVSLWPHPISISSPYE